jgi:hypothetical protein
MTPSDWITLRASGLAFKVGGLRARVVVEEENTGRPPEINRLFEQYGLAAAAAVGKLTLAQIDQALEAKGLSTAQRIEAKLKLSAARALVAG